MDVKAAERYVELVEQCYQADNIGKRVAKLVQDVEKPGICSEGDQKILNNINANITEIMIWAEDSASGQRVTTGHLCLQMQGAQ
jgi:hypothetical protein